MAGRRLRKQQEAALAALSDQEAIDLARQLVPGMAPTLALTVLLGANREGTKTLIAATGNERAALTAQLADDPHTARLVIYTRRHTELAERGLGITRSTSQQRR